MKRIRRHLTYANAMSTLAVFLLLGGGAAFAASRIGSSQLRAGSVRTAKIAREAVTAAKLRNDAVTGSKLADGAVDGAKIAPGSVSAGDLAASAQPTPVAALEVEADGTVVSGTPGVTAMRYAPGAYCVNLPFAASGGAVSTAGTAGVKSSAQVTVPADKNCVGRGYTGASVYTVGEGVIASEDWGGVFR